MSVARRLLLATDFSRASTAAFRAAVEWTRRERAELVVAKLEQARRLRLRTLDEAQLRRLLARGGAA
jgi:hypothetical protein